MPNLPHTRKNKRRDKPRRNRSAPADSLSTTWGWARPGLYGAFVFVLGLLIYSPALEGPFFLDDQDLLEVSSILRTGNLVQSIQTGRPLLMLTFLANYRIGGFEDTTGFHLVNILLHSLNALLLWRFLVTLVGIESIKKMLDEGSRAAVVYGVPLLFLTSPIQTESVAYISSRSEVLATTFFWAAMWVFVSDWRVRRPWAAALLSVFLFVAAASSKQDRFILLPILLLLDYFLLSGFNRHLMKANWRTYGLFAGAGVVGFFVLIKPFLFAVSAGFNLPWQPYLFTQFRMVFLYLRLLAVPFGLNADWDIVPSETLWDHFSWAALLLLALVVGLVFHYRRREPLLCFGALFFFVTLAPSTSFYPLLDFAAERRLYVPSVGIFLIVMILLGRLTAGSRAKTVGTIAVLTLIYSVGTFERARLWGDDLALWHDTAEKSPAKARPLTWLGKLYDERGMTDRAIGYWTRAEKLVEPGTEKHGYLLVNLGVAAAKTRNYAQAVDHYQAALKTIPRQRQSVVWANLAVAQLRLGRRAGWSSFRRARRLSGNPEVNLLYGQELLSAWKVPSRGGSVRSRSPRPPRGRNGAPQPRHRAAEGGGSRAALALLCIKSHKKGSGRVAAEFDGRSGIGWRQRKSVRCGCRKSPRIATDCRNLTRAPYRKERT